MTFYLLIFIYLLHQALVLAHGIVIAACGIFFTCSVWDLVLQPGIEPVPPALGVRSLSHCTTREVSDMTFY